MEPEIEVGGEKFELVQTQRDGLSGVYKSTDKYLRIGTPEKISSDVAIHKKMGSMGFPVPRLLLEGKVNGQQYFMESSLGDVRISDLFASDMKRCGEIENNHFSIFIRLVTKFAEAQLKTAGEASFDELTLGIHLNWLLEELPEQSEKIQAKWNSVKAQLTAFPFVLTHGDFNPNNMYPNGVIDFEDSFMAPFGYDLVTAFTHVRYFPNSPDYEYFAKYQFTQEQHKQYFDSVDALAASAGFPKLSEHEADFEFCRGIWSLVRMEKWPKIQKFRYDLFTRKFLG